MTQTPRVFLVGLLLALTACGGNTSVAEDPTLLRLQGQVTNWPGGAANVQLRNGATVLAQGSIGSGGDLALTLPGAATIDPALSVIRKPNTTNGCTSTLQISDPAARWRTFEGFTVSQNGAIVGGVGRAYGLTTLNSAKPGDYQVWWTYVDRPLDVAGTYVCPSYKETYDLHLRAGWNVNVLRHDTAYTSGGGYYEVTRHSGSDGAARWGFIPRGQ